MRPCIVVGSAAPAAVAFASVDGGAAVDAALVVTAVAAFAAAFAAAVVGLQMHQTLINRDWFMVEQLPIKWW